MICVCFCSHMLQQGWHISFAILCPSSLGKGANPSPARFSPQCLHFVFSVILKLLICSVGPTLAKSLNYFSLQFQFILTLKHKSPKSRATQDRGFKFRPMRDAVLAFAFQVQSLAQQSNSARAHAIMRTDCGSPPTQSQPLLSLFNDLRSTP